MDALTFRYQLLHNLSQLTDADVARIRAELDLSHDYAIDANGRSYLIKKNLDTQSKNH